MKTEQTLSLVIPCYNEENTLPRIVDSVLSLSAQIGVEIVIVDDCSSDDSLNVAHKLQSTHPEVKVIAHKKNLGKGAALRTGFLAATGKYVGIQDADMEYNPNDYLKMLKPIDDGSADIVLGSRYLRKPERICLKWWHSTMNRFLTICSNAFTDLDLTDMETCYKLFRRDIIQEISASLKENRFGFEPEVVSAIARGMRFKGWKVGEVAIEYRPRTFTEGKKIGWKDGLRAIYCIFHYNAPTLPVIMQLGIYFFIGLAAAIVNMAVFEMLYSNHLVSFFISVTSAFVVAAIVNYLLCVAILFRHKSRWGTTGEIASYLVTITTMLFLDYGVTAGLMALSISSLWAKAWSNVIGFFGNYLMRRFFVFGMIEKKGMN